MRRFVLLLAAVAAGGSIADYLAWRASHVELSAMASQPGLFGPMRGLPDALGRETEPARAATRAAWSLLDLEVDRGWLARLPGDEQAAQARLAESRLRLAQQLAEQTLPRRPASWQAAMALGAARYLQAERAGARRQPIDLWRRPLLVAMDLAPGYPEPPLFLAAALLSRWSGLLPAERDEARAVLARALLDPAGLELLLPSWARLAPSLDALLEVVPNRPADWKKLGNVFRAAGDLERLGVAHRRWVGSQPAYLAEQLRQARNRLQGGARRSAFSFTRRVVAAPPDVAFVAQFSAALAILPDDFEDARTEQDLLRWLLWALDLSLLGDCPLEEAAISRLSDLVAAPEPSQAALAALVAGDLARAGGLEDQAASDPGWHRYWIHKANLLAAEDPRSARRALERTSPSGEADPLYWHARLRLAELTGERRSSTQARRELERPARDGWTTADWSFREAAHRLVLFAPSPGHGFRLQFAGVPERGAAIELRWDGGFLDVATLQPGEQLVWRLPVGPGLHQLEVASLSGPLPLPGVFSLEPLEATG